MGKRRKVRYIFLMKNRRKHEWTNKNRRKHVCINKTKRKQNIPQFLKTNLKKNWDTTLGFIWGRFMKN
jgi:hypothetical protein